MKTKTATLCVALCVGLPIVATSLTGCAGDRNGRSTGQYIDDKSLTSRVRSALGDNAEFKFGDVSVTSYRSVVQLNGFVQTSDQNNKAGEIAKGVQGVKEVENNITVKE